MSLGRETSRTGRRDGFTLIEVAIAMGMVAMALMAVGQLIGLAALRTTNARLSTAAAAEAQAYMEQLKAKDYESPQLAATTHADTTGRYAIAYTVTQDGILTDTKQIDLTLSWSDAMGTHSYDFTTLIADTRDP